MTGARFVREVPILNKVVPFVFVKYVARFTGRLGVANPGGLGDIVHNPEGIV